MKTRDIGVEGNGNVENIPGTGSSPKVAEENPGVTYGVGIPNVASNTNKKTDNTIKRDDKRTRLFSNERPIL